MLAFLETGAYQEASAANFNGLPRPATVLVSGAGAEVVKRRETVDDVLARDVVPLRLGARPARMVRGIDHVGLTVSDLEDSLAFWHDDGLGLPLLHRSIEPDPQIAELIGFEASRSRSLTSTPGTGASSSWSSSCIPPGDPAPLDPTTPAASTSRSRSTTWRRCWRGSTDAART